MTFAQLTRPRALAALAVAALTLCLAPVGAEAREAPPGFLGVAANENRPANDEIDRMGRGNVGVLRVNINWAEVEPNRPTAGIATFSFSQLDRVVGRAAQAGVPLLPILYGTPKWLASDSNVAPIRTSNQKAEWQRFVRAMVDRYGPGGDFWTSVPFMLSGARPMPIRTWQVWNEPTVNQFFAGLSKKKRNIPRDYAKLLKLTTPVIRAEDPAAEIVAAGVFGTPHGGRGLTSRAFFRSFFALKGIQKHFDAVAIHPYSPNWRGVKIQVLWALRELKRADLGKKIWITELGWPTAGSKNDYQAYLKRSKKRQASTMAQVFNRLIKHRKRFRLEKVIWFTWRDNRNLGPEFERCNLCKFSGLFDESHDPKPSWFVYTAFTGGRS